MFQLELNSLSENNPPFIEFDSSGSIHRANYLHVSASWLIGRGSQARAVKQGNDNEAHRVVVSYPEERLMESG